MKPILYKATIINLRLLTSEGNTRLDIDLLATSKKAARKAVQNAVMKLLAEHSTKGRSRLGKIEDFVIIISRKSSMNGAMVKHHDWALKALEDFKQHLKVSGFNETQAAIAANTAGLMIKSHADRLLKKETDPEKAYLTVFEHYGE